MIGSERPETEDEERTSFNDQRAINNGSDRDREMEGE